MRLRILRDGIICATLLTIACVDGPAGPSLPVTPTITTTSVATNPDNALSALVSVQVRNADSVAIRFHLSGVPSTGDSVTPAAQTVGDAAAIPVLGLLPLSGYRLRAVAYGPGGSVIGDAIDFTTGALPSDLPLYTAGGADALPGYVVFAAGLYGVVIDNTGRVVWYHRFPNGPGLSFMAEPNGRYVARPTTPDPSDVEPWIEIDPMGNITRSLRCGLGLQSRPHDLITERDGSYWLMCDEVRTVDLTAVGGIAQARVTGTAVQHVSEEGTLLFHWSPFDHFAITDGQPSDRAGPNVNWTHGNALDIDVDGNLIVSFRNLGEITKINVPSGAVMWRLGGKQNQFTFESPLPVFSGQHSVRVYGAGAVMILDNVGTPTESRAEAYIVDEPARTAHLAHAYSAVPGVVTLIGGSVQSLPEGRTLVSFGTAGRVEEYDSAGSVTWRIEGNPGYVFRAQRIRSLYAPGMGTTR